MCSDGKRTLRAGTADPQARARQAYAAVACNPLPSVRYDLELRTCQLARNASVGSRFHATQIARWHVGVLVGTVSPARASTALSEQVRKASSKTCPYVDRDSSA